MDNRRELEDAVAREFFCLADPRAASASCVLIKEPVVIANEPEPDNVNLSSAMRIAAKQWVRCRLIIWQVVLLRIAMPLTMVDIMLQSSLRAYSKGATNVK